MQSLIDALSFRTSLAFKRGRIAFFSSLFLLSFFVFHASVLSVIIFEFLAICFSGEFSHKLDKKVHVRRRRIKVTEYLPGGSLKRRLEKRPPHRCTEPEARAFFRQIATAVAYLHAARPAIERAV